MTPRSSPHPTPPREGVRIWDPLVRIAHWSLAATVLVAYATGDHGGAWHERLGYAALAIVGLRIAWGFVGPRYARFADFVRAPGEITAYVRALIARAEPRYLGHNPLGALWILLLLALVIAAGGSGWALSLLGEPRPHHHWLKELHEGLANGLIAAVAVHVAGVIWESLRHGENLARAMLTGRKRAPGPADV